MSVKLYSYEDISKHNTRSDLWMVIDGKVYDITPFADEVIKNQYFFCTCTHKNIVCSIPVERKY